MTNKEFCEKFKKYDTDMQACIEAFLVGNYVNPPDIKEFEEKELNNKLIENCTKAISDKKGTVSNYYLEVRDAQHSIKIKSCIDNSIKNRRELLYGVF